MARHEQKGGWDAKGDEAERDKGHHNRENTYVLADTSFAQELQQFEFAERTKAEHRVVEAETRQDESAATAQRPRALTGRSS
jgi:hypothetical protein